ncbi:MAG: 7-cyano-7-deazaguanine synthase [Candidatus Omnitrophica bacterium]|nr:7-cyano-7-deazaguanine synthase [Candidatus Omnitrophota bacterium]
MKPKAVALFSGGLDSTLAIKLMLEQGIDVHALNFLTVFCTCTSKGCMHQATKAAKQLGVPLKVMNITEEYMKVVKSPRYGRGRGMNPCIDCRIFTFRKARDFMKEIGASFVITGEVLGERPMSQRRNAIEIIERESGLKDLIVRPLSAKLFEPTMPEKKGIVDRDRLLDIQGRQRIRQISLAKDLGINDYPCPAGGCLLTDKRFSNRLKDLFKYSPDYDISDLHILKTARQFRISDNAKLFVGRNEKENETLLSFAKPGDHVLDVIDIPSPIALVRGDLRDGELSLASSVLARYSDDKSENVKVSYSKFPSKESKSIITQPATGEIISSLRI